MAHDLNCLTSKKLFSNMNHNKSSSFWEHSHVTYHIFEISYMIIFLQNLAWYCFICLVVNSVTSLLCFRLIFLGIQFRRILACRLSLRGPWIMEDLFRRSVLLWKVSQFHQISWQPIARHLAWERPLLFRTMPVIEKW